MDWLLETALQGYQPVQENGGEILQSGIYLSTCKNHVIQAKDIILSDSLQYTYLSTWQKSHYNYLGEDGGFKEVTCFWSLEHPAV